MKVVVRGLAIDGQGLESLVTEFLTSNAEAGMALIADSMTIERTDLVRVGAGEVHFKVKAGGMFAPVIDERQIKASLRGKTLAQAQTWLAQNLELRVEPVVQITPAWWKYMPWLPGRIDMTISAHEGD
jgi:hypothetical protein